MKKVMLIFFTILMMTALIPAISLIEPPKNEDKKSDELVTIFNTDCYRTIQYFS